MQYNSRLEATQLEIGGQNPANGPPTAASTQFSYYADGRLRFAHDTIDERFDRALAYDQTALVKDAYSGSEARDFVNGTNNGTPTSPYRQSYQHDAFSKMTRRDNCFWSATDTYLANYTNNRRTEAGYQYDEDGNLSLDPDVAYSYDVAGNNVSYATPSNQHSVVTVYDGHGLAIKSIETQSGTTTSLKYYLHSTVLGGRVITELGGLGQALGQKQKGYVFAGSQLLATQQSNIVLWQHQNPLTGSLGVSTVEGAYISKAEFDSMGVEVGFEDPYQYLAEVGEPSEGSAGLLAGANIPNGRCQLDGVVIDCGWASALMSAGAAVQCPNNNCGPRVLNALDRNGRVIGQVLSKPFQAFGDGYSGFLPPWSVYQGGGSWTIPRSGSATAPSLKPAAGRPNAGPANGTPGEFAEDNEGAGARNYELALSPRFLNTSFFGPQNTPQSQTPCERKLAGIFGGRDAIMRTRYDYQPGNYRGRDPEAAARVFGATGASSSFWDVEHLYNFPHLSGNLAGTENTGVYIPTGFDPKSVTGPTQDDEVVTFYYSGLDVTLAVFHVQGFGINRNDANDAGSIRIGTTGGRGGNESRYRPNSPNLHSHFELWNGRTGYLSPGAARNAARIPFTFAYCP